MQAGVMLGGFKYPKPSGLSVAFRRSLQPAATCLFQGAKDFATALVFILRHGDADVIAMRWGGVLRSQKA